MTFEKVWYTVPHHIRKLPGMTLALLDFYETIFEFWNHGQQCFLSNKVLMDRTGIKSINTIHSAFQFFEKHNVMKRVTKNNKRYVVQVLRTETEKTEHLESVDKSSKNEATPPTPLGGGGTTALGGGGTSAVGGINNKYNNKKLNKSFCHKSEKQKNKASDSPRADVTKQSNSYDPEMHKIKRKSDPNSDAYKDFVNSVPYLRRKRRKNDQKVTGINT